LALERIRDIIVARNADGIFHITNLIRKDLKHPWTNAEMAQLLKMSTPHFQRLFKAEVSQTPNAYLKNARLDEAAILLVRTDFQNVKEICFAVGFTSYTHFARDFKKREGVTPTAFRERYWDLRQSPPPANQLAMNDRSRYKTALSALK
jgi:AraC-like DNA-binding protein